MARPLAAPVWRRHGGRARDVESFDQIRGSAQGNVAIMLRMLGAFQTLAGLIDGPNRRRALLDQVQWVAEMAERSVESAYDRARINAQIARVREALEADG